MLKIEKSIPVPTRQRRNKFGDVAEKMNVGDSVFVPGMTGAQAGNRFRMAAAYRNLKMKFSGRNEGDGARVWRTE